MSNPKDEAISTENNHLENHKKHKQKTRYFHHDPVIKFTEHHHQEQENHTTQKQTLPDAVKVDSKKLIRRRLWLEKQKKVIKNNETWNNLCRHQIKLLNLPVQSRLKNLPQSVFKAVYERNIKGLDESGEFLINRENIYRLMKNLIYAEEASEHIELRKYDLKEIRLRYGPIHAKIGQLYTCILAGLHKGQPSLIPTDTIIVTDGSEHFKMTIVDIKGDVIIFGCKNSRLEMDRKFDVHFVPSGMNYDRCATALANAENERKLDTILFGNHDIINYSSVPKIDPCLSATQDLDLRLSKLNPCQKKAIINVLEAKCRPHLYILFGPPGTGKTFTLVETVVQIHKRNSFAKILVCSGSNSCVDSLAASLVDTGLVESLARLSSKNHYFKEENRPIYFSISKDVLSKKILITTNMMSSSLNNNSYDYVFIDEAGHSHLPESLIPATKLKRDGCLVLAGDPKQLGPVIKSFEVERLGLGRSLLESLCELDIYSRNDQAQYNERYITKLVVSYRCDPRILNLCNDLFYHGELQCLGLTPPSILKILGFSKPLVFLKFRGQEVTPKNSSSRCNVREAKQCINQLFILYKMGLEPNQIGIITPYLLQKEILQNEFNKKLEKTKALLNDRFKLPPIVKIKQEAQDESKLFKLKIEKYINCNAEEKPEYRHIDDINFLASTFEKMKLHTSALQQAHRDEEIKFRNNNVPKMDWKCQIDTVDAFQGSEREIILVSTVRSPVQGRIDQCGFLSDAKRFNVTLSRAKWLVIVIGHPAVLDCCDYWSQYGKNSTLVKKIDN